MKLKLACADFAFPLLPHEKALQVIALLGLKGVDIGLFEKRSHLWPPREFHNVRKSARKLKRNLDHLGLEPSDVFLQIDDDYVQCAINHPMYSRRRKGREWFLKTLEYASICQCGHVTLLPGVNFEQEDYDDSFRHCAEELTWRVEQAQSHGIVIGVEAHIGSIVWQPKLAAKLIKQVPGLTLTLDYSHFKRVGLRDATVEPLIHYASHFHARGARKGRLQDTFQKNTIDYERIINTMERVGYRGWIGIEYTWIDWEHCNECDNLSETILFRDFFRSLGK